MKRGDVVVVAAQGDFGKPRPAVVVQSDLFNPTHSSFVVCPMTSELQSAPLFRIEISPSLSNGLRSVSQIMVDKVMAIRRDRVHERIGALDDEQVLSMNRALLMFLGLTGTQG